MEKTRVIVVDDSALIRRLLTELINSQPDMVCIASAGDPLAARELIRSLNPDVITLDVEMPHMDGIEFLSRLMRLRPMPVVMVSTLTAKGAQTTLQALELGAVDYVCKPSTDVTRGLLELREDIVSKIRVAASARVRRLGNRATRPASESMALPANASLGAPASRPQPLANTGKVVVIGASTGGTEATRELLCALPADMPPILIAQHMPGGFTASYAQRLDLLTRLKVVEARDGLRLHPGLAVVAAGGRHMTVQRVGSELQVKVSDGEPVNRHKPSVDVLFRSAARVLGTQALGVMLTGMGADGARAMREMRDAGAYNFCQDEASCVVFGMPREAIAAGAAHEVLPLKGIAPKLLGRLRGRH